MNCQFKSMWLIVLVMMTGGLLVPSPSQAQDTNRDQNLFGGLEPSEQPQPTVYGGAPAALPLNYETRQRIDAARQRANQARHRFETVGAVRAAAEAVRDAKDEEAKAAAQKKLAELLGSYFDEDTARREQELTKIEERVAKLRELLDRRRAKKQEILDLQAKVALNEAEGLGFYGGESFGTPSDFTPTAAPDPFSPIVNPSASTQDEASTYGGPVPIK